MFWVIPNWLSLICAYAIVILLVVCLWLYIYTAQGLLSLCQWLTRELVTPIFVFKVTCLGYTDNGRDKWLVTGHRELCKAHAKAGSTRRHARQHSVTKYSKSQWMHESIWTLDTAILPSKLLDGKNVPVHSQSLSSTLSSPFSCMHLSSSLCTGNSECLCVVQCRGFSATETCVDLMWIHLQVILVPFSCSLHYFINSLKVEKKTSSYNYY